MLDESALRTKQTLLCFSFYCISYLSIVFLYAVSSVAYTICKIYVQKTSTENSIIRNNGNIGNKGNRHIFAVVLLQFFDDNPF